MPWLEGCKTTGRPSRYEVCRISVQCLVPYSDELMAWLKNKRKEFANNKDNSNYDKAARALFRRQYLAFDYVIKYAEGDPEYTNWRSPRANKDIVQDIDNAFAFASIRVFDRP